MRKTLAASLHEVAKILGPEATETQLTPVFESFMKDAEDVSIHRRTTGADTEHRHAHTYTHTDR